MRNVTIIGGGASGLMAALELLKHNMQVTILEANNSLGGRICTLKGTGFSQPIETGAEFIHGNLPLTLSLLDEAGIAYQSFNDEMIHLKKNGAKNDGLFDHNWNKLMKQMAALNHDMAVDDFLNTFFGDDKYAALRASVKGFANGFDLADTSIASIKSLYREWNKGMEDQYRINGGYERLVEYLEIQCRQRGCMINTDCCVKKISWQKDEVNILTMCSRFFKADKIILTVPLSILYAAPYNENYIEFEPLIPGHISAAKNIGFGIVIKIILEFNSDITTKKIKQEGFFLTDEIIPTWWNQMPVNNTILTGWVGGGKVTSLKDNTDEELLKLALRSLSNVFDIPVNDLTMQLKAYKIANWYKEPHIHGGYSFDTTESTEAKKTLRKPVDDTLFFSGEALYEGTPGGTVEAALHSGKATAKLLLETLQ
jgi:monoamine oxidase